jgi:hypothetical protein
MPNEPASQTPVTRRVEDAAHSAQSTAQDASAAVDEATRALNEASRSAAEASRRAVERQADAAVRIARAFWEESLEANRQFIATWTSGVETAWRTAFDAQTSMLRTGLAFIDASSRSGQVGLQQWTETSRQFQQVMMEPLRAATRAADKLTESTKSSDRGPSR